MVALMPNTALHRKPKRKVAMQSCISLFHAPPIHPHRPDCVLTLEYSSPDLLNGLGVPSIYTSPYFLGTVVPKGGDLQSRRSNLARNALHPCDSGSARKEHATACSQDGRWVLDVPTAGSPCEGSPPKLRYRDNLSWTVHTYTPLVVHLQFLRPFATEPRIRPHCVFLELT